MEITKVLQCLIQAKGDSMTAASLAESRYRDSPLVIESLKSAVTHGSTSGWGAYLQSASPIACEFIATVRGLSVLGRLTAAKRVPLRIQVPRSTQAPAIAWVQEGYPVPGDRRRI